MLEVGALVVAVGRVTVPVLPELGVDSTTGTAANDGATNAICAANATQSAVVSVRSARIDQ
ncbi:MAG TPA: hypothetical protein VMJ74_02410 [Pseudomonadales bacterium]|nr:hypothetical protein [Pseudomonadales bacterium]